MRKWLSTAHMAHKFGVVPVTINRWTREGKLPKPITLAGKGHHRFWLVEEVEAWEQRKLEERGWDPKAHNYHKLGWMKTPCVKCAKSTQTLISKFTTCASNTARRR